MRSVASFTAGDVGVVSWALCSHSMAYFHGFFAWEHRGDPLVSLFSTEERLWNMSANQKKFRFFLLRLSPERLNLDLPPSLFPRN